MRQTTSPRAPRGHTTLSRASRRPATQAWVWLSVFGLHFLAAALIASPERPGTAEQVIAIETGPMPERVTLGIPFSAVFTFRNVSGREIAEPGRYCYTWPEVRRSDGTLADQRYWKGQSIYRGPTSIYRREGSLPADWVQPRSFPIALDEPGVYEISFTVVEFESPGVRGPGLRVRGGATEGPRRVHARSPVVRVEVVYPEGVDREAYEYFNGNPLHGLYVKFRGSNLPELLERFPCSIYAGWVVYELRARASVPQGARSVILASERSLDVRGGYRPSLYIPDRGSPPAFSKNIYGLEVFRWTEEQVTRLLACRDDLWFADELRLQVAVDRLRAGDRMGGKAMLREIVEKGNLPLAELAAGALRLLAAEEKGEGGLQPESGP